MGREAGEREGVGREAGEREGGRDNSEVFKFFQEHGVNGVIGRGGGLGDHG